MKRFDFLCQDVTLEERMNRYNKLAEVYDNDSEVLDWIGPKIMAENVKQYIPNKNVNILDVCAGTGHAAQELKKAGYTGPFDILDGSFGMVSKAVDLGIYNRIVLQMIDDAGKEQTVMRDNLYDAVIMSGGHASVGKCKEMLRLVKPKGYCIAVMYAAEYDENERKKILAFLAEAEKAGKCKLVKSEDIQYTSTDAEGQAYPGSLMVWHKT